MDHSVENFTGERALPLAGNMDPVTMAEHLCRYEFALAYAQGTVLDAACGGGYGSEMLAATAASVTGIDLSAPAVTYARQIYGAPNIYFLAADVTQIPLAGSSFDLIVSFETIEHVSNGATAVAELQRLLKSNGVLILSVPQGGDTGNKYHLSYYQRLGFRHFLGRFFDDVTILYQRGTKISSISSAPLLSAGFPGEYIIALCRKPVHDHWQLSRIFMYYIYLFIVHGFEQLTPALVAGKQFIRQHLQIAKA